MMMEMGTVTMAKVGMVQEVLEMRAANKVCAVFLFL
jgi:hypothetical protein